MDRSVALARTWLKTRRAHSLALRERRHPWLEALKGDRAGQHSIRINQQWRICFVWTPAGPEDVEIVDYH